MGCAGEKLRIKNRLYIYTSWYYGTLIKVSYIITKHNTRYLQGGEEDVLPKLLSPVSPLVLKFGHPFWIEVFMLNFRTLLD